MLPPELVKKPCCLLAPCHFHSRRIPPNRCHRDTKDHFKERREIMATIDKRLRTLKSRWIVKQILYFRLATSFFLTCRMGRYSSLISLLVKWDDNMSVAWPQVSQGFTPLLHLPPSSPCFPDSRKTPAFLFFWLILSTPGCFGGSISHRCFWGCSATHLQTI